MNTELDRVAGRIAPAIIDFMRDYNGGTFHAETMRRYVRERCGEIAPASPDRAMRLLRKRGKISYVLISRPGSMYWSKGAR